MSRGASFSTAAAILRRIKEGRGQGDGRDYTPWQRVKDVPSKGRRHRIFSPKYERVLHLMSDLERAALFASECIDQVNENREQVPHLPPARTQEIARRLGYKHPRAPGTNHDIVIATDQVWTLLTSGSEVIQPIFIKYTDDLQEERVQEKREIEALSWTEFESPIPILPLKDFTELTVNQTFVNNWDLIRDTLRTDYFDCFPNNLTNRVDDCVRAIAAEGIATLDEIAEFGAGQLRLPQSQILTAIHYLVASMSWPLDLESSRLAPSSSLKFINEI